MGYLTFKSNARTYNQRSGQPLELQNTTFCQVDTFQKSCHYRHSYRRLSRLYQKHERCGVKNTCSEICLSFEVFRPSKRQKLDHGLILFFRAYDFKSPTHCLQLNLQIPATLGTEKRESMSWEEISNSLDFPLVLLLLFVCSGKSRGKCPPP